jgi:hypothetical protein
MAKTAKAAAAPAAAAPDMPGVAPKLVRHRVLYVRGEPTAGFQPVATYEVGDPDDETQGEYLFASIRAELINKARAAAAPVPFFLEQSEEKGFKVED